MHSTQPALTPMARNECADGGPGEGQGRVVKGMEGLSHIHQVEGRYLESSVPCAPRGEKGLGCYEASPQRPDSDHRQDGLAGLQRLWASNTMGRLQWQALNQITPMHPRACVSEPDRKDPEAWPAHCCTNHNVHPVPNNVVLSLVCLV